MKLIHRHCRVNVGRATSRRIDRFTTCERSLLVPAANRTFPHPRYAASHFRKSRLLRVKSIKNVHAQGARDLTIATAATARC
jgi:hypothetical protein